MKSFIFAYFFCGLIAISIANNELQNNDFYDGLGRMSMDSFLMVRICPYL
ncbi:hypothetical protein OAL99_03505 [Gammaproteobacteria bacterium]|nr:hypothetical protein [Gammaproteobacteria bacterium]